MIVNIVDYGKVDERYFVTYDVLGLNPDQVNFLDSELEEETSIEGENLKITMYFNRELYPFQSDVAKFRLQDFISREEIEMNVFLSSFLEEM